MAEKDLVERKLEDYNDVFADILNTLLFKKRFLDEKRLRSGSTESVYKDDQGRLHEQRRDTFKEYQGGADFIIAAFGIENQSGYDRTMPVRIMGYDSAGYKAQVWQKRGRLHPVITVVLNFSNRRWGRVRALRDLMGKLPQELEPYVQDYRIHVFDIAFLRDDVIASFRSDFKVVAGFFKNRRLGRPALTDNTVLHYPAEIVELLAALSQEKEYFDMIPVIRKAEQKGERVTMCWVAQKLIGKGKERGENLMAALMQKLFADGRMEDARQAASNEQARKQLYREYGLAD